MLGRWIKMQRGEFLANSSGRNETWTARGRNETLLLGREYSPRVEGASKLQDRAPHRNSRCTGLFRHDPAKELRSIPLPRTSVNSVG
jgi:hypothetical protein